MFKTKMLRKNFSLIELLIVIGIMGALAALILPAFSDSETAAKDTACDYNQAGTLRYLTMFHSANGVYPTGFHTGGSTDTWGAGTAQNPVELTVCAKHNFENASDDLVLEVAVNGESCADSLINAGIVTLAYGQGDEADYAELSKETITVKSVKACGATERTSWTEELDPLTGEVNPAGAPLTFRGVSLGHVAQIGQLDKDGLANHNGSCLQFRKTGESTFKIVPLYVAPTIDWTTYYVDGPNDSKVSVAMTSKCPWGEDGVSRYYIAFFKVYEDGTPAKLLCTSCPDCGILEGNAF